MGPGASTPEELETLFEDAFVTRDRDALAELFDEGAVVVAGGLEARGGGEIGHFAVEMWERKRTYVADPRRILQSRDTALLVADGTVNVARRGSDGAWRYAIALLALTDTEEEEP